MLCSQLVNNHLSLNDVVCASSLLCNADNDIGKICCGRKTPKDEDGGYCVASGDATTSFVRQEVKRCESGGLFGGLLIERKVTLSGALKRVFGAAR